MDENKFVEKILPSAREFETQFFTVHFLINDAGIFEIKTPKKDFVVSDDEIEEREGRFFFQIPPNSLSAFTDLKEVEIPGWVIEKKDLLLFEIGESKNSIGYTETPQGKVFFSITGDGKIRARLDGSEEVTEKIYNVEGKRVLFLPEIGLDNEFVEIPAEVEKTLQRFKLQQEYRNLHLVYAGRSLLTGVDYYKFNYDITVDTFNRVKSIFEYIEEDGQEITSVSGWVTTNPKLAEQYLRLRKNTVEDRKEEIEKQKAQAVKENEKIIKKLMAS